MTNTSQIPVDVVVPSPRAAAARKRASRWPLLSAALLLATSTGMAAAATLPAVKPAPVVAPRTTIVQPSANAQFQQKVQQAQMRSQLQQAQVEQQNQQALSQNLNRPYADNPQMQQQTNQANAAQQRIDRARQQSIIDRYNAAPPPAGRVAVPVTAPSAKPASGGR